MGAIILTVGSGLIYTLESNSGIGKYVGYQVVASAGSGIVIQSLPKGNPNVTAAKVLAVGANDLRRTFPDPADLNAVVSAYTRGLKAAWIWGIAFAGLSFFVALGAEWKSIRAGNVKKRAERKAAAQATSPWPCT